VLPVHIRKGELELRLFSTTMTLGTPQDVTLQELRIETFFPWTQVPKQPGDRRSARIRRRKRFEAGCLSQ
jgi:hypothetical protein